MKHTLAGIFGHVIDYHFGTGPSTHDVLHLAAHWLHLRVVAVAS